MPTAFVIQHSICAAGNPWKLAIENAKSKRTSELRVVEQSRKSARWKLHSKHPRIIQLDCNRQTSGRKLSQRGANDGVFTVQIAWEFFICTRKKKKELKQKQKRQNVQQKYFRYWTT